MTPDILTLDSLDDPRAGEAAATLERGGVVLLPNLPFALSEEESAFLDPAIFSGESKNVSLDPATGKIGGTNLEGAALEALKAMIARYSVRAQAVLAALTPSYGPVLQIRRTSFRPGPVDTRVMSKRKDDRRLHVDAFPANPVQGRRILRVFTNVNPHGESRHWGDWRAIRRLRGGIQGIASSREPAAPGVKAVGLTKGPRTAYDSAMLQLHDGAKGDDECRPLRPEQGSAFRPIDLGGVLRTACCTPLWQGSTPSSDFPASARGDD